MTAASAPLQPASVSFESQGRQAGNLPTMRAHTRRALFIILSPRVPKVARVRVRGSGQLRNQSQRKCCKCVCPSCQNGVHFVPLYRRVSAWIQVVNIGIVFPSQISRLWVRNAPRQQICSGPPESDKALLYLLSHLTMNIFSPHEIWRLSDPSSPTTERLGRSSAVEEGNHFKEVWGGGEGRGREEKSQKRTEGSRHWRSKRSRSRRVWKQPLEDAKEVVWC